MEMKKKNSKDILAAHLLHEHSNENMQVRMLPLLWSDSSAEGQRWWAIQDREASNPAPSKRTGYYDARRARRFSYRSLFPKQPKAIHEGLNIRIF